MLTHGRCRVTGPDIYVGTNPGAGKSTGSDHVSMRANDELDPESKEMLFPEPSAAATSVMVFSGPGTVRTVPRDRAREY